MSALLSISSVSLAYSDSSSNPTLKHFDWKRSLTGISVDNPQSQLFSLAAGEERTIFDGTRSTSIDGTTQFTISLSTLDSSRYRFTWTSGTNPVLRTARSMSLSGIVLTLVANSNGTLTITAGSGSPFSAVVVGDTIFVPGTTTGDSSIGFNVLNEGSWTVLSASSGAVTLVRPSGVFEGVGETVTPSSNDALAYSSSGIQVGDNVDVSVGFSSSALRTYEIVAVTSKWFEVTSTTPLVAEAALPTASGMIFYTNAKRFIRIESDQESVVRVNGDTSSYNRLSPWSPGDVQQVAEYTRVGPTWTLKVLNRAVVSANVLVMSAE